MTNDINLWNYLDSLDFIVFSLSIILIFSASIYAYCKKNKDNGFLDYLLMGRALTLPLFVATLVSTWYGGIFGVTKIAFEQGIYNFITQGVFWYITYFIFALWIVPKIRNSITLPEMIGKMFGKKSYQVSAIFNFVDVLPISYIMSLAIFLQMFFPLTFLQASLIGTIPVALYSAFGGFRAVVYTDVVQFTIMCLSVFILLIFSICSFGGISFLKESLPDSYFSLTGGETFGQTIAWGIIALSTLVDPSFYQRVFAARNKKIAKYGIFISIFIWFLFDLSTTLGAMYARAIIPDADSKNAYLIYGIQLLPSGLRGFLIAGILSTILSTMDSYLFIAGTTLSFDLMKKKANRYNYLGIFLSTFIAVIIAQFFDGNIKTVWKLMGSYFSSALLIPVLAGFIFPGKFNDKEFCVTASIAIVVVTIWNFLPYSLDALYVGSLSSILTLAVAMLFKR